MSTAPLLTAIRRQAASDTTLWNLIDGHFYYDWADDDVRMPYVVYTVERDTPVRTFAKGKEFYETSVEFQIFDKNSSVSNILTIAAALQDAYDRESLTYVLPNYGIGCWLEDSVGPYKNEDGWDMTLNFGINYH